METDSLRKDSEYDFKKQQIKTLIDLVDEYDDSDEELSKVVKALIIKDLVENME